jgi:hypothetical protein
LVEGSTTGEDSRRSPKSDALPRDLDEGEARNQFAAAHLPQVTVVKDPRQEHNFIVSVLLFVLDIPKGLPWTRFVSCLLMIINK